MIGIFGGISGILTGGMGGSMNGTTSSLISMFSGNFDSPGNEIENMAMPFLNYFSGNNSKTKTKDMKVQTRMYGKMIPEIFGKMRVSGNIIWHSKITTTTVYNPPQMSKGGQVSGGGSQTFVKASFAVALGQGPIDMVNAIYANEIAINLATLNYTVYNGTETQMPDSTMQAFLGTTNVPAFRGLAYIVFNDFPLEQYNNSVPNLTYDVTRTNFLSNTLADKIKPEQMITGVNIIPATGESVYDTVIQTKYQIITTTDSFGRNYTLQSKQGTQINKNTAQQGTDFTISMSQMQATLPNLKWVSLVVGWFADSVDIANANIYPAHESYDYETFPDNWSVAGLSRSQAKVITKDLNGNLNYGGTVSDVAVIRAINYLKAMGYKICLYPMIFLDTPGKPWRGRMTGTPSSVTNFFTKPSGYNNFIKHYANITKGLVDAFIIGSEMIGITSINNNNQFPGVQQFVALAAQVKRIVSSNTKIIYASDWSEYHHTTGGWFNMDPLWSSPNIDIIGIDAYFPLSNSNNSITDMQTIQQGWISGEGYDFYYTDANKTVTSPLSSQYAWKNINYFWNNTHINPDGSISSWIPGSKPIWFTEYGFPSIDCCTNQPNLFYNPTSSESGLPLHSTGIMDIQAQRAAISATENQWANSSIVEQKMIWTWDARPYPAFPSLTNFWSDSVGWKYGHFLNGKLGSVSSLGDIVKYLCILSGINYSIINTTDLQANVLGLSLDAKTGAIQHIAELAKVFNFDARVEAGNLVFKMLSSALYYQISSDDILMLNSDVGITITKSCDSVSHAGAIELLYTNPNDSYKINTITASLSSTSNATNKRIKNTHHTSLALMPNDAQSTAFNIGLNQILSQTQYKFQIPMKYSQILPNDIISFRYNNINYLVRLQKVSVINATTLEVEGIDTISDNFPNIPKFIDSSIPVADNICQIIPTFLNILDINNIDNVYDANNITLYLAVTGSTAGVKWQGCQIYISYDNQKTYNFVANITNESISGQIITPPNNNINPNLIDYSSNISVLLNNISGITSISIDDLFNLNNLALIGNELISFKNITQANSSTILASGLLRGRFGTENMANNHQVGEKFILLNKSLLTKLTIPLSGVGQTLYFKAVSNNDSIYNTAPVSFVLSGNSNKSFLPSSSTAVNKNANFNISFLPRSNYENSFYDSSFSSKYNYDIIINNLSGSPISKISSNNVNNVVYSQTSQINDFGSLQTNLNYNILPQLVL